MFIFIGKKVDDKLVLTLTEKNKNRWFSFESDYNEPIWAVFAEKGIGMIQCPGVNNADVRIESDGENVLFTWGSFVLSTLHEHCEAAFRQAARIVISK